MRGKVLLALGAVAVVLVIGFVMIQVAEQHARWETWCRGVGGHVDTDTRTAVGFGTAVSPKGNVTPVTTISTSTTYFCLSEDGRILDIR